MRIRYNSFLDLPASISEFLFGEVVANLNDELVLLLDLTPEQSELVQLLESKILCREVLPSEISEKLTFVGFSDEMVEKITQRLLIDFCGPIRWYFDDLEESARVQGVTLPISIPFSIDEPTISQDDLLLKITPIIAHVPESIREKLTKFLGDVIGASDYDESAFSQKLTTSITGGGFGMSQDRTEQIVEILRDYVGVYRITSHKNLSGAQDVLPPTPLSVLPRIEIGTSVLDADEVGEIEEKKQVASEIQSTPLTAQQQQLAEAVLAIEPLDDRSPELQQRWKFIVHARLGGVRNTEKTRALMQESAGSGGLGLTGEETQRLLHLLEETASRFEKHGEEVSVVDKLTSVQKNTASIVAGPEARAKTQQRELNDRFVSMFGKDTVSEIRQETRREIESFSVAHPDEAEHASLQVVTPEPKYLPKVPDKLKQLIDAENPVFPIKPKASSVEAPVPSQKKSSDIRPGSRLVGPIDELRIMTLVDFRRLSPDASVRIQKIRSKLDVIGRDGAHEKIRAVQAFEQSEPVRLYRELLRSSLIQQKDITELSLQYKQEGKGYLEPEEIDELRSFLSQIRYVSV